MYGLASTRTCWCRPCGGGLYLFHRHALIAIVVGAVLLILAKLARGG
jgi:hypothetical protein